MFHSWKVQVPIVTTHLWTVPHPYLIDFFAFPFLEMLCHLSFGEGSGWGLRQCKGRLPPLNSLPETPSTSIIVQEVYEGQKGEEGLEMEWPWVFLLCWNIVHIMEMREAEGR